MTHIVMTPEYQLIRKAYAGQRAKRSGVYYMAHIDEGLAVMQHLGHSLMAQRAYCLHPLVQEEERLHVTLANLLHNGSYRACLSKSWLLAMEYRAVANAYLSSDYFTGSARLSVVPEVNQMLIADKVQNRKDFEKHHAVTHPRALELSNYFKEWLAALGIREDQYQQLKKVMTL